MYNLYTENNSCEKIFNFVNKISDKEQRVVDLVQEWHKGETFHSRSYKNECRGGEYLTKDQTNETFSSANFGTAPRQDNFKLLLDSYAADLSN